MSRRAKRMERHHQRTKKQASLNMVSLMDIFTILVFFLLVSSSSVQDLPNAKKIKLPESVAQKMPKETVECLELIVKGDKEGWSTHGFRDEAKLILVRALKTEASISAENVIHYLGSRGYLDFRTMLNRSSVS